MHVIGALTNLVEPCEEIPDLCLHTLVSLAESVVEQARKSLSFLKETLSSKNVESCPVQEMEKISSTISCIQGFLWGLASALDEIDGKRCKLKLKSSQLKCDPLLRIRTHIDVYADLISDFLDTVFLENDFLAILNGNGLLLVKVSSSKGCGNDADYNDKQQIFENTMGHLAIETNGPSFFDKIESQQQNLKKSLLLGFLRGENLEVAFFLRQLFIAYSAILRINLHANKKKFLLKCWNPTYIAIAEVLLLEFADMVESPHELCFVWLDSIAKFLEEFGKQIYSAEANPINSKPASTEGGPASTKGGDTSTKAKTTLTNDEAKRVYDMLNNMHVRALGKCIALQGKGATLASHETESSIKTLDEQTKLKGGKISSTVAGGVHCLDLVLEYVKVKTGNLIFQAIAEKKVRKQAAGRVQMTPDSGSVILMIIEGLTRVFRKNTLVEVNGFVSQSLRISGGCFQNILQHKVSKAKPQFMLIPDSIGSEIIKSMDICAVDRQFIMELYAACCRLLCTVLKHYKRKLLVIHVTPSGACYVNVPLLQFNVTEWNSSGSCLLVSDKESFFCASVSSLPESSEYSLNDD
ncbi:hypothetical protein AgCh_003338 [Apium graveolens]